MDNQQSSSTEQGAALPLWARVADLLALGLFVIGGYVATYGGFIARGLGIRVALRSEWRLFAWAAAFALFRHLFVRRPSLPGRILERLRAIERALAARGEESSSGAGERSPSPVRWSRPRVLGYSIGIVIVFAALTAAMTYPQVRVLDRAVTPDSGDPLLSTWRLAWFAHQLPRDPRHLFDANIFYPERNTLAFSDAMLVPSAMIAPLVWLGVPHLLAYNVLLLSAFALSGAAM